MSPFKKNIVFFIMKIIYLTNMNKQKHMKYKIINGKKITILNDIKIIFENFDILWVISLILFINK